MVKNEVTCSEKNARQISKKKWGNAWYVVRLITLTQWKFVKNVTVSYVEIIRQYLQNDY